MYSIQDMMTLNIYDKIFIVNNFSSSDLTNRIQKNIKYVQIKRSNYEKKNTLEACIQIIDISDSIFYDEMKA